MYLNNQLFLIVFSTLFFVSRFVDNSFGKYVEGHLKTIEDWAFLARFCFISGVGRYEYYIEFERRYGEPQLLLYYDSKTQWPAIYKTDKTCNQKLSVLSVRDNQIISLSARPQHAISGCTLRTKQNNRTPIDPNNPPTQSSVFDEIDPSYYDKFLPPSNRSTDENRTIDGEFDGGTELDSNYTFTLFNETDTFNISENIAMLMSNNDDTLIHRDIVYQNTLENGTEFLTDVEELFDLSSNNETIRIKRSVPGFKGASGRGTLIVTCSSKGSFISSRPRWWYIAIANCNSGKGIDIYYRFKMTNGEPGDFWNEHFSADEIYIPPILLVECLSYTFLLLCIFLCAIELKTLHLFHCTYRLFTLSAILQWSGALFLGVAWAKYGMTGLGPHTTIGHLLTGASEITFMTLMLLMAKGYTITRARLSSCSTIKLTIFINLYIVVYVCLFIFQALGFDPGEVLNLYESPAGFGLAGLRVGAWVAFVCSVFSTIRKYPEKSTFYYPFGLLGSLWILSGPFLTLLGIGCLDPWVRESVMCGSLAIVAFGGHASFLWITWPSRANKSFPYHVRTNHVGIASNEDDGVDYPRHMYAPTVQDQNIIIPLSRRTEELLNSVYGQYMQDQLINNSNTTVHSHISFPHEPSAPAAGNNVTPKSIRTANKPESQSNNTTENDIEQIDSGHQSIECSPNVTESSSPKAMSPIGPRLKNNPFIVNGVKRQPNKVILEPIEQQIRQMNGHVPKHLFAAKRPSQ